MSYPTTFRDGPDVYITTRTPKAEITAISRDLSVAQFIFGPGRYHGPIVFERGWEQPGLTINGGAAWGAYITSPRGPWLRSQIVRRLRGLRYRLLGRLVDHR